MRIGRKQSTVQDNTNSNYELDFEVLILIEPDTDGIMYHSEFYNKKMVMKYFAWFRDADNMENFYEYCKLWYQNFEDVPFTIEGKKCKIPTKNFQSTTTGELIPDINDICQYLNKRGIYVKDMAQIDFQSYLADYFMFPLFEAERIQQKEKSFEEIIKTESRLRLRTDGLTFEIQEFGNFVQNKGIDIETFTDEAFREIVVDYFYLKQHQRNTTSSQIAKESKAELQHQEIALLYFYDELPLNDNNAKDIAEKYGQTSGIVLMKHYRSVNNSDTQRRNHKNAKKYLETVIPLLTTKEGIEKAKRDLENVKPPKK